MNNEYVIDLAGVTARKELHERIEAALPVPEWYGKNLDALHDVLDIMLPCSRCAERRPTRIRD